ncbi:hypothetical protein EHN07_17070 [Buttiauxella warmboldiae]|uniref:Uncharacterized protein n=1 Tax=Buttiauxella warmboldiae TaxID=82993 RepID=A0A3N5D386_9ENTR|nr:hypothetical protein [Buttiauxella warmboldiae]RPH22146.1 hypothetical protein EHN07_17070 [Buttiauxella warmboldiae]
MVYQYALVLLISLAISGCSSQETSGDRGHKTHSSAQNEGIFIRSHYPAPYYGREKMTAEQRRAISERIRAERLEARGRSDNSTDSGDGFGQSVPNGYFN